MARRNRKYNIPKEENLSWKEKGVIYVRVFSPSQVKNWNGLESQEALCKELSDSNGVEIVKLFSDGGISGKYS